MIKDKIKFSILVSAEKLNRFDPKLNGIVLDIQSIKVVGENYAVRNDSSALHISLNVKFYVFQPRIGAILLGIVKHVALHHISVTIHRFFNVTIPIEMKNVALKTNMSVMVKLTKFDLDDSIPYFEAKLEEVLLHDLPTENSLDSGVATMEPANVKIKREIIENGETYDDNENGSDNDTSESLAKRELSYSNKNNTSNTNVKVNKRKYVTCTSFFVKFHHYFSGKSKTGACVQ